MEEGIKPNQAKGILVGDIVRVMMESTLHRDYSFENLHEHIMPAISRGDFLLHKKKHIPIGFVCWGWFSDKIKDAYLHEQYLPTEKDFNTGQNLVMLDLIAPFGNARFLVKALRRHHKGQKAYALRFKKTGKNLGVRHHYGHGYYAE